MAKNPNAPELGRQILRGSYRIPYDASFPVAASPPTVHAGLLVAGSFFAREGA
jgi:hypothetical protein